MGIGLSREVKNDLRPFNKAECGKSLLEGESCSIYLQTDASVPGVGQCFDGKVEKDPVTGALSCAYEPKIGTRLHSDVLTQDKCAREGGPCDTWLEGSDACASGTWAKKGIAGKVASHLVGKSNQVTDGNTSDLVCNPLETKDRGALLFIVGIVLVIIGIATLFVRTMRSGSAASTLSLRSTRPQPRYEGPKLSSEREAQILQQQLIEASQGIGGFSPASLSSASSLYGIRPAY